MSKTKEKLMIIDGNALIHRSFHALPPTMKTSSGQVVNAVYGFASFLFKAIAELKPEYVVLTLDKKGPTFRHEKFADYKAKRVKAPDELYEQIPLVRKLAQDMNIPVYEKDGFEADDLIGTIINEVRSKKLEVRSIIVTGDKDTMQLVDDKTEVYSMSRGITDSILYDEKTVFEKLGVRPDQVVDYKALAGDPSDNIPGVPGIGAKTAADLLRSFGSIDNLYSQIENRKSKIENSLKPRTIDLLSQNKDSAYLSRELATIKCDVPLEFDLEAARFLNFDKESAINAFTQLEFKSLLPRLQSLIAEQTKKAPAMTNGFADKFERNRNIFKYILIDAEKDFKKFLTRFKKQKAFSFDTETGGLDPFTSDLLGISVSWEEGEAYYLNLHIAKNTDTKSTGQSSLFAPAKTARSERREWLDEMKGVFADEKIKKCAHNAKFDIRFLKSAGVTVNGLAFDTMLAAYVLRPGQRQYNIDSLAFAELGFEKISKDDLLSTGRGKINFCEVETEKLSLYSCEDADFCFRLWKKFETELVKDNLKKLFDEIELPLVSALVKMEDSGICLDADFLKAMAKDLGAELLRLEKEIHGSAGTVFNVKSTKQLKEVLFDKLQIPVDNIKKTKTGLSTSADELDKLRDLHPIIPLLQKHRELAKLLNTYLQALPELVNPVTGRVHTSFNQTIAATGRLSSSDPNLQNIPIRTELGRRIRQAFVAKTGFTLLALDYSQIELRLAAHLSGDPKLIEAFKNNADIHTSTAAEINSVPLPEVTSDMRREAKAINFGVLYGQGAHGLMQAADIPYIRAKEFIEKYFTTYSGIKNYIDSAVDSAKKNGYSETLFGRRRYIPELQSTIPQMKNLGQRMAVNTPIQGTSADMIKIAMIRIHRQFQEDPDLAMLLQVHDELLFEVKEGREEFYAKKIKEIMENIISLSIPIIAEAKAGKNWGEMKKV